MNERGATLTKSYNADPIEWISENLAAGYYIILKLSDCAAKT